MLDPVSTSVVTTLSNSVGLLDKVGLLQKIKNKLVNHPDIAAAKLTGVLNDIGKTYEVVDDVLVQFVSMSFEDDDPRRSALLLLNKMGGGNLKHKMMEARASCTRIGAIYRRYLTGWFNDALNPEGQYGLQELFYALQNADNDWIGMLSKVAEELKKVSKKLIKLLEEGRFKEAEELRKGVLDGFREVQSRLSEGIVSPTRH